jgi:hypothetical protein
MIEGRRILAQVGLRLNTENLDLFETRIFSVFRKSRSTIRSNIRISIVELVAAVLEE